MIEVIEKTVATHFRVPVENIRAEGRERKVTDARHFIWYILNNTYGIRVGILAMTYHTSRQNIHYALGVIREGIRLQPFYIRHYREIISELKSEGVL